MSMSGTANVSARLALGAYVVVATRGPAVESREDDRSPGGDSLAARGRAAPSSRASRPILPRAAHLHGITDAIPVRGP